MCAYCGDDLAKTKMHIEHVRPLCCGGTNKIENLVLSCPTCNLLAGSKWFEDFYQKQLYILQIRQKRSIFISTYDDIDKNMPLSTVKPTTIVQ